MAADSEFVAAIRKAFVDMDSNDDKVISRSEVEALLTQMFGQPVPDKCIDEIMKNADKDKSGSINNVDELITAMCDIEILQICSELRQRFKELDTDGNGKLTREEVRDGWSKVSKGGSYQEMVGIITKADTDGDGYIDCEEFVNFILQKMLG